MVLIQAFIHVGDLALAEGVAQVLSNRLHGNAESAGGVAINDQGALQTMHLLVGIDVAEFGDLGQSFLKQWEPNG